MSAKSSLLGVDAPRPPSNEVYQQRRSRCRRLLSAGLLLAMTGTWFCLRHMPSADIRLRHPDHGTSISTNMDDSELCLTPACVHAASELLYNLAPNYQELDPCTNFEELVCGGWKDRHDLRPDQGDAFTGTIMSENSQLLLRHILEASYPKDSSHSYFSPMRLGVNTRSADEDNFNKMKAAYEACLDEQTIKSIGLYPLGKMIAYVKKIFTASAPHQGTKEPMLFLAKHGIYGLIAPGVGADDTDPDTVVVSVSPPWRIGLPSKERYKDDKLLKRYQEVIAEVLLALDPETSEESPGNLVEFEKKLAAASPSTEEREDVTKYYNPMSLEEASSLTPQIDLAGIVKELAPKDVEVKRVIVGSPKYMKKLAEILDHTSADVVRDYFVWKTVQALAAYVDTPEVKPYKRFVNELAGKDPDSEPERWRTCVSHVDDGLGWILSRFFVEKAFSADAKQFGDLVVSDIKDQFVTKLKATEWMDDDTTAKAIEKVHNIVQKIGYPTKSPDIMDPDSLAEFYQDVNITKETYFANMLYMRTAEVRYSWSALGKPVDREQWGMTVPTVNAYYNPPGNEIVFPAGIMQFPVFDVDVPAYLSYGAFGSVAGHELSHAFDSTGRHYDQTGNYTDWWSDSTVKAFEKRAQCFVDQYAEFSVPGTDGKPLHVNGRLTLGENIADAGGLTASFQAWLLRRREKPNRDLPGLEFFSQEQLFFVSYANWWCGKSRRDTAINRIYTDPHAPKWARILGTMANSREFRESFQCEQKEPTCELW